VRKGETMSAEQRAKIGRSLRGKPKSEAHKKATSRAVRAAWRRKREVEKLEARLAALRG
jgi:hypothetical protein